MGWEPGARSAGPRAASCTSLLLTWKWRRSTRRHGGLAAGVSLLEADLQRVKSSCLGSSVNFTTHTLCDPRQVFNFSEQIGRAHV